MTTTRPEIEIRLAAVSCLKDYARIPIAFDVTEVLLPDLRNVALVTRPVAQPWRKDYDTAGQSPTSWPERFDLSGWQFFVAFADGDRVGGAALVTHDPSVDLLEGRDDLGLLWDLRVAPTARRSGVGTALLAAVEERCRQSGLHDLKVETQDINVPACRFYARHGFRLRSIDRLAYPSLPDETQLLWVKSLR